MFDIPIILLLGLGFLLFLMLMWFVSRYKRCPSDKILVVYGKTGKGTAKCIHGGASFVWPVIQAYEYLDLSPIVIDVDLKHALSRQNIRVNVPSRFTVGISTENDGTMIRAAERLLGKKSEDIRDISKDIIFGQLRLVIAMMDIEEINADRDKFLTNVSSNVGNELKKIGLQLINVNITDIQDESGYIESLGKEAAAGAINEAKKIVAQKNRDGSVGEADAKQEERIKVSQSLSLARVGEAQANAKAVEGENLSKVKIAESEAQRRQKEAEALRIAIAAEKIQSAKALEEAYVAEREAEEARALKEKASKEADIIVQAEIEKRKIEIQAEAEAERLRLHAKGEADAIFLRKEAEAKGMFEILRRQAEGFDSIVKSANGVPRDAVLMLIADKLPELVKTQVDAIKGMKIDKVTVWENGSGEDGMNSTAKFVSGLYKAVPPMSDLFNMAGMDLPSYLGDKVPVEEKTPMDNTKKIEAPQDEEK